MRDWEILPKIQFKSQISLRIGLRIESKTGCLKIRIEGLEKNCAFS